MCLTTTKGSNNLRITTKEGDKLNSIKSHRENLGLSQKKLAEKLCVSQQAVTKWETGESRPRAEKLPEIARLLGCSVDDLFKEQTAS